MDISTKPFGAVPTSTASFARPTREEAEAAVRTLIAWAGDDPTLKAVWKPSASCAPMVSSSPVMGRTRQ